MLSRHWAEHILGLCGRSVCFPGQHASPHFPITLHNDPNLKAAVLSFPWAGHLIYEFQLFALANIP